MSCVFLSVFFCCPNLIASSQLTVRCFFFSLLFSESVLIQISGWDPNAAWDDSSQQNAPAPQQNTGYGGSGYPPTADSWNPDASWGQGQQNYAYTAATGDQTDQVPADVDSSSPTQSNAKKVGSPPAPEFYKSKDPKASQILVDPLIRPAEGGAVALITWRICYPIHYLCQKTVPDCRTEKYRNWYGFTFVISMLWISFYSYLMVIRLRWKFSTTAWQIFGSLTSN